MECGPERRWMRVPKKFLMVDPHDPYQCLGSNLAFDLQQRFQFHNGRVRVPRILLQSIILVGRNIMRRGFIGRERELAELQERWRSGQPELFVVYGRRRVGKIKLLLQFFRIGQQENPLLPREPGDPPRAPASVH